MEIDHVFHPDHKLVYKKVVKRADKGMICAACKDVISSEHYSCGECNFFLHKLCAERPSEFTHPLHSLHPLRLLPKSPYGSRKFYCNACRRSVAGFTYHCDICKFDLDFVCAFPDGSKMNHVCHPTHALTYEKVVKKADKGVVCAACLQEISGPLANYYSCRPCNIFLHESCSQRPSTLTSSLHPQHPLSLLPTDPFEGRTPCDGCQKPMRGFVYHCRVCYNFDLDFKCAFPKQENRIQNFEQLHHHPLIFQARPAKFSCDLCSSTEAEREEEDQSYSCSTCNFYVHKTCAYTTAAERYKYHNHPLSLVQGVHEDLQIYGFFNCDVCHNAVCSEDWVAHCARCRYFVHVSCMITDDTDLISSIEDGVDHLDNSLIQHLFKDDEFAFAHWPPRDVSLELIKPFLLAKNGIVMDVRPVIRDSSHKQHNMILFEELRVNNDSFFEEEDEEIICDGCIHPITAPYYCCQECNYYLHLACANLPSEIKHFNHHHELKLVHHLRFYMPSICDRCERGCNGLIYWCKICNFALDLTCAALPAVIMHETHDHPLFQKEAEVEGPCYACGKYAKNGRLIFKCTSCDVYLHYKCATLTRSIRHRWDRQHPILLRYPPHGDHPDHFMCDMCEKLIHPKRWLYSCFSCDISFHTNCVPRYEKSHNIKFGGEVQRSSHPHILKFLRKATLKNTCDECEDNLDNRFVFECETCYYCICIDCGRRELDMKKTSSCTHNS